MKNLTCCFSGNRPKHLPWGYKESGLAFFLFKRRLKKQILKTITLGYTKFISGMALGIDMICAEIILKIKKKNPNILLECALPCKNQTYRWSSVAIKRYNKILELADKITYITKANYTNGCMQKRNNYMVDNSQLLIASFTGVDGGTKQTIEYAIKQGVAVKIIKIKRQYAFLK